MIVLTENWYDSAKCAVLSALALSLRDRVGLFVEVGCWQGRSTMVLANAIFPQVLHCVDHWKGDLTSPDTGVSPQLAASRDVQAEFVHNMNTATHGNYRIFNMDWEAYAASRRGPEFAFVHLDAAHDYESVYKQVLWFNTHLVEGGMLVGDDYSHPGVYKAVNELLPGHMELSGLWVWKPC